MRTVVSVTTSSTRVLEPNRARVLVVLTNNSDTDMYVAPDSSSVLTEGIPLKANGGSVTDDPDTQGYIYKGIWTAICSGTKNLSVVELSMGEGATARI